MNNYDWQDRSVTRIFKNWGQEWNIVNSVYCGDKEIACSLL